MFFLSTENDRPTSLVPDLIDYNMPLTATYLKQMKLQCMTTNEQVAVHERDCYVVLYIDLDVSFYILRLLKCFVSKHLLTASNAEYY